MASWQRWVFAILKGCLREVPLARGILDEVWEVLEQEREEVERAATRHWNGEGEAADAEQLQEVERLAGAAAKDLPTEVQRGLGRRAEALARAQDTTARRALAGELGADVAHALLEDEDLRARLTVLAGIEVAWAKAERRIGDVVHDRYELRSRLGRGGMAVVYEAWDRTFERRVALKLAGIGGAGSSLLRARFEREAKLSHAIGTLEGVVRALDWGEDQGALFLAMDLVEDARPLDLHTGGWEDALARLRAAATLVGKVHERGVIHRDLKPGNILQSGDGSIYLTDFGLGKILSQVGADEVLGQALTQAGDALGTPAYMSPEQCFDASSVDPRTDVYAFGAMLFDMLTGQPPFPGRTVAEVFERHKDVLDGKAPTPSPQAIRPEVPDVLDALTVRTLAALPSDRTPSVEAFVRDLDTILDGPTERDPEATRAFQRARQLKRDGAIKDALTLLDEAVDRAPAWASPRLQRANLKLKTGDLDAALRDYDAILAFEPDHVRAHVNRALLQARRGEVDQAIEGCTQALRVRPDYVLALGNRGALRLRAGQYEGALEDLSRAVELDPDYAKAWYWRGQVHEAHAESEAAAEDFGRAVEAEPTFKAAQRALDRLSASKR